jgi:hypothetical protein
VGELLAGVLAVEFEGEGWPYINIWLGLAKACCGGRAECVVAMI